MPGFPAGRLRDRVAIELETRQPNGQGGFVTAWAPIAGGGSVPAQVIGLSGDEAISAAVERSVQQWRVTIRDRPGLTTKHRLRRGGQLLDVKSILPHPNFDRTLVLICESSGG